MLFYEPINSVTGMIELTELLVIVMRHKWTDEERKWLEDNINNYSWKTIVDAFNLHFGFEISQPAIEHFCLRHKITHGRENESGFITGEHNSYSPVHPIGTERTDSRGRVFIKISNNPADAYNNWVQKDRYVWKQAHGKLSRDELLIHLDQDKKNCGIDNLYKVSRETCRRLASFNWFFQDREMTLAAIKCCELIGTLKGE